MWRHSAFHCAALIEHLHRGEGRHASRAAFRTEDALSSGRLNVPRDRVGPGHIVRVGEGDTERYGV